ncbi:hypothetical protein Misp01_81850 [Microtetraspora sp. NBRC 13810]|uniref:sigma factor n=1 Tax=Microtetraspora sp. NBRC 13810 TaxID=3030990 RepID=UPI0024A18C1A|nr:sigma factor [Microtetraspora sp. NBRC 13810]GLW13057.1 hypothetical protein Misp01_81850 [Microtetraspora sp. NBRC 13810]
MADRAIFQDFVVARSDRLLRFAYLLTHDWATAEDLLQESLAKAWFAWPGIDEPEAYVRRVLITTYTGVPVANSENPTDIALNCGY